MILLVGALNMMLQFYFPSLTCQITKGKNKIATYSSPVPHDPWQDLSMNFVRTWVAKNHSRPKLNLCGHQSFFFF